MVEYLITGFGIVLLVIGLVFLFNSYSELLTKNPYPFPLSLAKKKKDVIILSEKYPNKIKTITKGLFGEKGLYLPNEKIWCRSVQIDEPIFVLLELEDGTLAQTSLAIFDEKKQKISGFLKAEFDRYHELLNITVEKVSVDIKDKELTTKKSLTEQIRDNAGIIGISVGILILIIASIMINVSQASELIKPSAETQKSLSLCQETLKSCQDALLNNQKMQEHKNIYEEIISPIK